MERKNIAIAIVLVVLLAALGFAYVFEIGVNDFESCSRVYPVLESYPAQCNTLFGKHFVSENRIIGGDTDEHGCLVPAGYTWNATEERCVREWESGEERYRFDVDFYFNEQMWMRGVDNLGGAHPIEGFDPNLYLGAYSGLVKEDFDGVSAIGGKWELESGELVFVSDGDDVVTSADGTVDKEGMRMLLDRLEERYGINVESKADVDALLDQLSGSKYDGGLILMQNKDSREYACFGCNGVMCKDPAPVMKTVQETDERYCDSEFNVVEVWSASKLLRFCPDEWYDNQMPRVNNGGADVPQEYYVVDGERRETYEFDADFVGKYCDIEKKIVS